MMFDFVLDAHIINETTLSTILEYDTHTHTLTSGLSVSGIDL